MTIDELLEPVAAHVFFGRHWNVEFLHVAGVTDRFAGLLDWPALNEVLQTRNLMPPALELLREGERLAPEAFLLPDRHGIDAGAVTAQLAQGATLVVNHVDRYVPRLALLAEAVEAATRARTFVNLYASWHRHAGLGLHWDMQDTFILQVRGRKHWKVHAPTQPAPLDSNPPKPDGAPAWEGDLNEGDLLYLPRGWWHLATPVGEPSLHLTVSMVPPRGGDLLRWLAKRLETHEVVRKDLPLAADAAAQKARVAEIGALVTQAFDGDLLAQFEADYIAALPVRPSLDLPHGPDRQTAPIQSGTRFWLAGLRRIPLREEEGRLVVAARDKVWRCDPALRPALAMLSSGARVSLARLLAALPQGARQGELVVLLMGLSAAGVVLRDDGAEPA